MGLPGMKGENGTAGACKRVFLLLCCTVRMCAHVCASKEVFIVNTFSAQYVHTYICVYVCTYVHMYCVYIHTVHTYMSTH